MTSDRPRLGWLGAAAAFIAGLAYLYRPLCMSGLTSGADTDTFIQIALLQNWSNCLSGYGSCLSPNYFYPLTGTIGFNDGYFLSGLLYHCLRWAGLDPFIAHEMVYVPIRLIGFVSVIVLGTRWLALPFWWAVFAAWLGLVSINLLNQIVHTQLIYAAFVPLGMLCLLGILNDLSRKAAAWKASLRIAGFCLLCAAWASTAFYSFFFFMILALLFAASLAALRWERLAVALRHWSRSPAVVVTTIVGLAATPLALWMIYGAAQAMERGHAWSATFSPRIQDLFNVGPDNPWSPLLASIYQVLSQRPLESSELSVGFPAVFLLVLVCGLIYLIGSARRGTEHATAFDADHCGIAASLALASLLMILILLRIGNGFTLWYLVWKFVPGAVAIRVPARFLIFLTPLLCLIVACALARLQDRYGGTGRLSKALLAVLVVALTIEQYNARPEFKVRWRSEADFLASVPPPLSGCRAFYVSVPRRASAGNGVEFDVYGHAVDAMLVAALLRIPTLNGVASVMPADFRLDGPLRQDYEARVARHAARFGVADGLCALDLKSLEWSLHRQ